MKFNNHDMSHGGGIIHADYGKKWEGFTQFVTYDVC
jgi:hypothetical protein